MLQRLIQLQAIVLTLIVFEFHICYQVEITTRVFGSVFTVKILFLSGSASHNKAQMPGEEDKSE
jgi:hypothetical protein